jgi:hypothetical protein
VVVSSSCEAHAYESGMTRCSVSAERCVHLRASGSAGDGCSLSHGVRQGVNAMATLNIALVRCNS